MHAIKKILNSVFRTNEIKAQIERTYKKERYQRRLEQLEDYALHSKEIGITDRLYTNHQVIVSLTTYGRRILDVAYTIESIFQQTMPPNKVILWLDNSFRNKHLPCLLQKQTERGLTIGYCEDIKSYKKLIPTLKLYPNDIIITIDDDVLYHIDFIENLMIPYLENPKQRIVYCNRCHKIKFDHVGSVAKYSDWDYDIQSADASKLYMPTGVGGVLYPPHCFYKDITDELLFMSLAPKADDIWLKAMTLLNGYSVKLGLRHSLKRGEADYFDNEDVQDMALGKYNVIKGGNDEQFKNVDKQYNLTAILKS